MPPALDFRLKAEVTNANNSQALKAEATRMVMQTPTPPRAVDTGA